MKLTADDYVGRLRRYVAATQRRAEFAALDATHRATVRAKTTIRDNMGGAGLGRLGQAIGSTSDLARGRTVHRSGRNWSASGMVYIRSKSPRTVGALESYTVGASIVPVRSRWLWIPSDEIARIGGSGSRKRRLTPGNWSAFGMDSKVGPLVQIKGPKGNPLLVVRNVAVLASGKKRSARALLKRGGAGKGRIKRDFIIAFIGIPATSRRARVNLLQTLRQAQADLPTLFREAMERTFR